MINPYGIVTAVAETTTSLNTSTLKHSLASTEVSFSMFLCLSRVSTLEELPCVSEWVVGMCVNVCQGIVVVI